MVTAFSETNVSNSGGLALERKPLKPEMRVLHVFSALGMGGAETWLMSLLRYFHEHESELPFRIRCDVLLTGGMAAHFDSEAKKLGANLFYLPYTRGKLVRFAFGFRRILSRGNYHVIHDHQDYTAGWHFLFGAGRLPLIRISHVHNPYFCVQARSATPVRKLANQAGKHLLSKFATHITGTSWEIVERYGLGSRSFAHLKRRALYCGFDVVRFSGSYREHHASICREFGWEPTAKVLLFAGRLDSIFNKDQNQKNPRFALEVAKECIRRDSRACMLMAGNGQNQRELEDLVKTWGLEKAIRLIGVRDDIARLMIGSDLLLFPSLEEGLGMVAVEAQASGLRVLASNRVPRECVVLPELLSFRPLDSGPGAWAEEALRLLAVPRPDFETCNNSVRHSDFAIENSARALLDVYGTDSGNNHVIRTE